MSIFMVQDSQTLKCAKFNQLGFVLGWTGFDDASRFPSLESAKYMRDWLAYGARYRVVTIDGAGRVNVA